jgi:hypothetical protein
MMQLAFGSRFDNLCPCIHSDTLRFRRHLCFYTLHIEFHSIFALRTACPSAARVIIPAYEALIPSSIFGGPVRAIY